MSQRRERKNKTQNKREFTKKKLDKGRESWQGSATPRFIVHDDLTAVEAHDGRSLLFRVGEGGVVLYRPLPLP